MPPTICAVQPSCRLPGRPLAVFPSRPYFRTSGWQKSSSYEHVANSYLPYPCASGSSRTIPVCNCPDATRWLKKQLKKEKEKKRKKKTENRGNITGPYCFGLLNTDLYHNQSQSLTPSI